MSGYREIRADYDGNTIGVYQAYNDPIANAALKAQRFVPPFSMNRMTWIKPSFLWLMERSNWGTKSRQERILMVRIMRTGWDRALSLAVLTGFESKIHGTSAEWQKQFSMASVHVQWDPERSFRGAKLEHRSIQVGIGRSIIEQYVNEWTSQIVDMTPRVAKLRQLRRQGRYSDARRLLPPERVYPIEAAVALRLGMNP